MPLESPNSSDTVMQKRKHDKIHEIRLLDQLNQNKLIWFIWFYRS